MNVIPKIINVVSGSTMTGVIDATLYGFKSLTKFSFCDVVRFKLVVLFTDMKTLPYSGVELTPVLVSKLPSYPPHTDTACVLGKSFLT